MELDRRHLFALAAAATAGTAVSPARAAPAASPISAFGIDAAQFGLRPGSPDDQSRALQRAIDDTARTRAPLALAPGVYRAGNIKLAAGTQLVGTRGATRLVLTDGPSLLAANGADSVTLSGLVLDGGKRTLPERRGLVQLENCRSIKIADCEIRASGRNGLVCIAIDGEVIDTTIADTADVAIHVLDARGLVIARNTHRRRRQQRHPGLAVGRRRRRHHRGRQPHREYRQPLRRLRPIRQRHQRLSRRQRDRARQPHQKLRLHRGARQRRLQHPDRRQQHRATCARSRSMPSSASRAR